MMRTSEMKPREKPNPEKAICGILGRALRRLWIVQRVPSPARSDAHMQSQRGLDDSRKSELKPHLEGLIRWNLLLTLNRFAQPVRTSRRQSSNWVPLLLRFLSIGWQICALPDLLRTSWRADPVQSAAQAHSTWPSTCATVTVLSSL